MSAALLTEIRALALALPETSERLSHGQPTFFARNRQFAQFRANHHGDGITGLCVRTSGVDEAALLIAADPACYARPAYLAGAGWVTLRLDTPEVDWEDVARWLAKSHAFALPR